MKTAYRKSKPSPSPYGGGGLAALVTILLLGCRPQPVQVVRRVPVDVVSDCVALRRGIADCGEEFAEILMRRRVGATRTEVLAELQREVELPAEDRVRQCRAATADAPPPHPDDVARLHACLPLPCRERAACLQPILRPLQKPATR
jgi:hypothetical protein